MPSSSEALRCSTLITLEEIIAGERAFKERFGVDISDEEDWMEARDIIRRIERKLQAQEPAA